MSQALCATPSVAAWWRRDPYWGSRISVTLTKSASLDVAETEGNLVANIAPKGWPGESPATPVSRRLAGVPENA
jgi:hypothetical protein